MGNPGHDMAFGFLFTFLLFRHSRALGLISFDG